MELSCEFCRKHPSVIIKCYNCSFDMCTSCKNNFHTKIDGSAKHIVRKIKNTRHRPIMRFVFFNCCKLNRNSSDNLKQCMDQPIQTRTYYRSDKRKGFHLEVYPSMKQDGLSSATEQEYHTGLTTANVRDNLHNQMSHHIQHKNDQLEVMTCYTTDIPVVSRLVGCKDGTLWMTRATTNKLQKVKVDNNSLTTISKFNIKAYDIAQSPNGDLLIASTGSILRIINSNEDRIILSKYDVSPYLPTAVHVNRHGKVIIGAMSVGLAFPATGERKLMFMDTKGVCEDTIENDKPNNALFTYPYSIISDDRDFLYILDRLSANCDGRIIILNRRGSLVKIYNGHPVFNIDKKFKPKDIAVTKTGILLISETHKHTLHILDNQGSLLQYYNTRNNLGVSFPQSLDCSQKDRLVIGTSRQKGSLLNSKLYILKFCLS